MKSKKEIIKSSTFWLTLLQNELFRQLKSYMETNRLSKDELADKFNVSKNHISQILNGDCNFTLKKLIDLSLKIGKIPVIKFVDYKDYLNHEEEINKLFEHFEIHSGFTKENGSQKKLNDHNYSDLDCNERAKSVVSDKPQKYLP